MDERRAHERINVTMAVSMRGDRAAVIWATMEDVSLGGAFVKTSHPLEIGVLLEIITLVDGYPGVVLPAVVCRVTDRGVGVKWGDMEPRHREFLAGVVSSPPR